MSTYDPPPEAPKDPYSKPPWAGGPNAYASDTPALAQWAQRVGASLVDMLVLLPFYLIQVLGTNIRHDGNMILTLLGSFVNAVGALAMIGFAIWNHVIKQGSSGYTIGKGLIGIRLLKKDSLQPIGAPLAFGRQVLHFVDTVMCLVGFLWPLWDEKRQTIADKLVGTIVVIEPKR